MKSTRRPISSFISINNKNLIIKVMYKKGVKGTGKESEELEEDMIIIIKIFSSTRSFKQYRDY